MAKKKLSNTPTVCAHVYAYRKAPGLPVTVGVSPDVLDLSQYAKGAEVLIEWTLVTEGFIFPKDGSGIVFTSPGNERGITSVKTVDPTKIVALAAPTGKAYAYTVTVVDKATGLIAVVDPTSIHPPP